MIFAELRDRFNTVINHLDEIMVEAMVSSKEEIIDLNISQLDEGIGSTGLPLDPEYASPLYAQLKKAMGSKAPLGIPNLEVTGDFKHAFETDEYVTKTEGMSGLLMYSTDEKAESLEGKYQHVFGITPDNANELAELIVPQAQKRIINEITG